MPVTVATSFLVISLKALVRPDSRHRDAALLFARSDEETGSDGDRDSDSDSNSDSEDEVRRPFPPATAPPTTQTRTSSIMSTSQTHTSSGNGGVSPGQSGTTIAFGTSLSTSASSSTSTTTPGGTLPSFTLSDPTAATASENPLIPVGTGSASANSNARIGNGPIIGMTLGVVFLGALIWMLVLKLVKRRRRARKMPRGFIPSNVLVDSQSFRGSVTELPIAPPTTTTGSSFTSSARGRFSFSPFAALRMGYSPSPPPLNPPPPPGLTGLTLRRSSQPTSLSSYHTAKPISTLSSHREEQPYPEEDPLYLAVPPPPPPRATVTGTGVPRGTVPNTKSESVPSPVVSNMQTGMSTSTYTSYDHPYRTSTAFRQNEYDGDYDEEGTQERSHPPNPQRDPPPSYGVAF